MRVLSNRFPILLSPEQAERRNRIRLSIYAYAYEFDDAPLITDAEFDALALEIDPQRSTGHPVLDQFFREHFVAYSAQWVRRHPELDRLAAATMRVRRMRIRPIAPPPFTR